MSTDGTTASSESASGAQHPGAAPGGITALSNAFVADWAALSPLTATAIGYPGREREIDDLSPAGLDAFDDLIVATLAAVTPAAVDDPAQESARRVLAERLQVEHDRHASGWAHANLNVIESPLQMVRMVFDVMPTATDDDWSTYATRMRAVPAALAGYRESLALAASRGQVAAIRQVEGCAGQCDVYAGGAAGTGFFSSAVAGAEVGEALAAELAAAAEVAEAAYAGMGAYLRTELRPVAPERDAVGAERYRLSSRLFLGATLDLQDTYDWGWQEFLSIEAELRQVADRILPGGTPKAAADALDADPAYQVTGRDGLREWLQQLSDRAVADLGVSSFDIPPPLRVLQCNIAPPGGVTGAYYLSPSDDFSRPGGMWWSVESGRTTYPVWRDVTTVYHEGVPGHHLQLATAVLERDRLNDFQRLLATTSGHAEGWALYAERLVRELGYLTDDAHLLGMLDAQLFRAARVVLDIGMHLELPIPIGSGFHEGETWTPALGLEFLLTRTLTDEQYAKDEIDRYLGWPGQAPAYKVGERVWLQARDAARSRHGDAFDEKSFHTAALRLGGMGLAQLADELATL